MRYDWFIFHGPFWWTLLRSSFSWRSIDVFRYREVMEVVDPDVKTSPNFVTVRWFNLFFSDLFSSFFPNKSKQQIPIANKSKFQHVSMLFTRCMSGYLSLAPKLPVISAPFRQSGAVTFSDFESSAALSRVKTPSWKASPNNHLIYVFLKNKSNICFPTYIFFVFWPIILLDNVEIWWSLTIIFVLA